MNRLWLRVAVWLEALKTRERVLVGAAAVLLPVALIYVLFIDPALTRERALRAEIGKQREAIALLERAIERERMKAAEPDTGFMRRENELKGQIAQADETLKAMQRSLVPAQRVPVLLREMLARDSALQLVSLRTLPVTALASDAEKAPAAKGAPGEASDRGVYKHGVEITVRGSYGALHAYLARLERAPWTLYWWRAQLATDERPALKMTITIYTLSLDKAWLEV
jgi:MSHA biogenesis protein MshJ